MQEFLVLGIVPGTDIQLGFGLWLLLFAAVSIPICIRVLRMAREYWYQFLLDRHERKAMQLLSPQDLR